MDENRLLNMLAEHMESDTKIFSEFRVDIRAILDELKVIHDNMDDLMAEIGGVPRREYRGKDRGTIRDRLHVIESDRAAAKTAQSALDALRAHQEAAAGRRWTGWQKWAAIAAASVAAVSSVLRLFGVGG